MKVLDKAPLAIEPRRMSINKMQDDYEYEMANKMAEKLFDNGLISLEELNRIKVLNTQSFSPFYGDIMG